jgi:hypothetical protein
MKTAVLALGFWIGLCGPAFPEESETLTYWEDENLILTTYGERGYAIRYKVPDPSKVWYAKELNIFGEVYGEGFNKKETHFVVAFADLDGNVYSRSEYPYTLFPGQTSVDSKSSHTRGDPRFITMKIKPTQLPPEFWLIVDFFPVRKRGIYIGLVKNGGGHSKMTDHDLNLIPTEQPMEVDEPVDWCMEVKVEDTVSGRFNEYDRSAFPEKVDPDEVEAPLLTKTTAVVNVKYRGFDEPWADAIIKVVETALAYYREEYGFEAALPINAAMLLDTESETPGHRVHQAEGLLWTVKSRNELLPMSRGGPYPNVFSLCRCLAQWLIKQNLERPAYGQPGLSGGMSAVMAAEAVVALYRAHQMALWPISYNYFQEEGPDFLRRWIDDKGNDADERAMARLMYEISNKVGEPFFHEILRGIFSERLPAREVVKRIHDVLDKDDLLQGEEDRAWLASTFTAELVNPPILWLGEKPDIKTPSVFAGLKAKRYKSDVILQYDIGKARFTRSLEDEEHAVSFMTPPGAWRISDVRIFAQGKGLGKGHEIRLRLRDGELEQTAVIEVACPAMGGKRPKWYSLGGWEGVEVSGPFYFTLDTRSGPEGKLAIGLGKPAKRSHSLSLFPGSHAAPVDGASDWMVRLYLTPVEALDKDGLDGVILNLRKSISR